jgi:hypothetical protein
MKGMWVHKRECVWCVCRGAVGRKERASVEREEKEEEEEGRWRMG